MVIYLVLATIGLTLLGGALRLSRRRLLQTRQLLAETRLDLVRRIREAEDFRIASEHASDGIVIQDLDARIRWVNPAYCRIVRMKPEDILGRNPLEFVIPEGEKPSRDEIESFHYDSADPTYRGLLLRRNLRSDGELFWNQHSVSFHQDSAGRDRVVLVCRDVTEQVEAQQRLEDTQAKLEYSARHDILTGLANRTELLRYCSTSLEQAASTGDTVGILHFDVDKFKEINDTHGHTIGDRTLEHVGRKIAETLTTDGLAARLGGDEFVVVVPGAADLGALAGLGEVMRRAIAEPTQLDELSLSCGTSIGAALAVPGCTDPEDLMLRSDFALYEAKRRGRGQVAAYDELLHRRHSAEIRRSARLRDAIETGDLTYMFQPVMDMARGQVAGFETLVRWRQPDGSILAPDQFLPLAQNLGLMGELDLCAMQAAMEMLDRLRWAGWPEAAVAFNASEDLLEHPDFIPRLIGGIDARGIDRSQLLIEVIETTMFDAPDSDSPAAAVVSDLRAAGFRVALDDFGAGYAGLGHLTELDISGIKIDRTLAAKVLEHSGSAKVVETIVALCDDLGLQVIAEGVETAEMAHRLFAMGAQLQQGYWISRPLEADAALEWLRESTLAIEPPRAAL